MTKVSSKSLNRNFRVKVYGKIDGHRIDVLLGFSGASALLGADLLERLFNRALNNYGNAGKTICKLRRGINVTFYER